MSIFGHSMGGHGALILALKNPGKYKVRPTIAYMRYTNAYIIFCKCDRIKHYTEFFWGIKYINYFSCCSSLLHVLFSCCLSEQSVSAFAPICNPIQCQWGKKALGGYLGPDASKWEVCEQPQFFNNRWMNDLQTSQQEPGKKLWSAHELVLLFYYTPKHRKALFVSGRSNLLLPYGAYENVMRYRSLIKSTPFLSVL